LDALRAAGVEPYPVRFDRDLTLGELRDKYGQLPADSDTGDRVRVAGRLMLIRRQGGLSFAELRDRAGHVQLFVDTHEVGVEKHHTFDHLDRGDIVGVEGTVMTTHTGELSVKVDTFQLLSKGIRPLPEKGMDLTEALFREAAQAALGTTIVTVKGETVDLAEPFRRATMVELIKEKLDVDINPAMDVDEARKVLDGLGVPYERDWGAGKMTDE